MAQTRKKLDLIQELTTHKNDYKPWPMPRSEPPQPEPPEEALQQRKPVEIAQIDYQSHLQYATNVPFDLYHEAKPIVGTDPRVRIPELKKPLSTFKTDHFLYKFPGKLPTDVTEEEMVRQLVIATYSPVHIEWYKDACLKVPKPPQQPDCVLINDKTGFVPQLYPPLPPGWLKAAKHWDCLQSRVLGDPTKTFWLRRGPEVECFSKTDHHDDMPEETKREIRTLIEEDRLRLPYTITKTGYAGYRQMTAKGVPLARNKDITF